MSAKTRAGGRCLAGAIALIAVSLASGCNLFQDIEIGVRQFRIDVSNGVFAATSHPDEWQRGLDATDVQLAVVARGVDGEEVMYESTMLPADVDATHPYTRVSITIEGVLLRVEAEVSTSSGDTFLSSVIDKSPVDSPGGWTVFANITRVKLGYIYNGGQFSDSAVQLAVTPRGGHATTLLVDSGVQSGGGVTDRGPDLVSQQLAVELVLHEHPGGLTFDVYTAVVDDDLPTLYDENLTTGGFYLEDPWSELWTFTEITDAGRSIASTIYSLARETASAVDVLDPQGDGKRAYLIDLTGTPPGQVLGQYLLIGVVLHGDALSAPLSVRSVEIF